MQRTSEIADRISAPKTVRERFDALRQFYAVFDKAIHVAGKNEWGFHLYDIDWIAVFSPIETALWHDIRAHDVVLYPQYPVGRYFVDFANPVAKVAVECDGAAWHIDKDKDAQRQSEIEGLGWTVYRISGADCKTDFDEEAMRAGAASQFISDIAQRHGIKRK